MSDPIDTETAATGERCGAAIAVAGEVFVCDSERGHGMPHGSTAAQAIWQGDPDPQPPLPAPVREPDEAAAKERLLQALFGEQSEEDVLDEAAQMCEEEPPCEVCLAIAHGGAHSDWLAQYTAKARAAELREAATKFQINTWADVITPALKTEGIPALAVGQAVIDWLREEAAPHESADALPVRGDGDLAEPATYNAAIDAQVASVADLPHDEQVEVLAIRYVTLQRVYRELRADRIDGGAR